MESRDDIDWVELSLRQMLTEGLRFSDLAVASVPE